MSVLTVQPDQAWTGRGTCCPGKCWPWAFWWPPAITWEHTTLGTWPEGTAGSPAAGGVIEEEPGFISVSLGSN